MKKLLSYDNIFSSFKKFAMFPFMKKLIATIIFLQTILTLSYAKGPSVYNVDEIQVFKREHKMLMLFEGEVTREYFIRIGKGGYLPKVKEGDGKVPEGTYFLDAKNPKSKFYKSIRINYPNEEDVARAELGGYDPGGQIFIHAYPKFGSKFLKGNWSKGCIVVENWEMQEIWDNIPEEALPLPIKIFP